MMNINNKDEPNTAPKHDQWYNLKLGSSFKEQHPSSKFCTLRYEFKPASIDKSLPGKLHKTKDNRVTVEFHNSQPGKPKVCFEGSSEDYKENDAVLFFDGESFRLERLHRAVKRLKHVRLPGESVTGSAPASVGAAAETRSPPVVKVPAFQSQSNSVRALPFEVELIEVGDNQGSDTKLKNDTTADYSSHAYQPNMLSDYPSSHANQADMPPGYPYSHASQPNVSPGYPSPHANQANMSPGYPSSHADQLNMPAGYPSSHADQLNMPPGYPSSHDYQLNMPPGYPSSHADQPNMSPGYPSSRVNQPNMSHGYPSSHFSQPNTSPEAKSDDLDEQLDIMNDDEVEGDEAANGGGGDIVVNEIDINKPHQNETDGEEFADVVGSDEEDNGLNAGEALRGQANGEEGGEHHTSSSSSSSGSDSSGSSDSSSSSESDSSTSDSDSSDEAAISI